MAVEKSVRKHEAKMMIVNENSFKLYLSLRMFDTYFKKNDYLLI